LSHSTSQFHSLNRFLHEKLFPGNFNLLLLQFYNRKKASPSSSSLKIPGKIFDWSSLDHMLTLWSNYCGQDLNHWLSLPIPNHCG
jgi:hypothetical protein